MTVAVNTQIRDLSPVELRGLLGWPSIANKCRECIKHVRATVAIPYEESCAAIQQEMDDNAKRPLMQQRMNLGALDQERAKHPIHITCRELDNWLKELDESTGDEGAETTVAKRIFTIIRERYAAAPQKHPASVVDSMMRVRRDEYLRECYQGLLLQGYEGTFKEFMAVIDDR